MKTFRQVASLVLLAALFVLATPFAAGQTNLSQISSNFYAQTFSQYSIPISIGNPASGASTIAVTSPQVALRDGRNFIPFSTNVRLTINDGASSEVVTPTAVSGCNQNTIQNSCLITATFSFAHGQGASTYISSGSCGLDEAALAANQYGGGVVVIDSTFQCGTFTAPSTTVQSPLVSAVFLTKGVYTNVVVEDRRSGSVSFWRPGPGLTAVTLPTALTKAGGAAATLTTATTGGSIATATTPRFTITCVDFFGGESAAADDSSANAALVDGAGSTNSYTITAAGVPVATGCVGYRLYVSATGGTTQTETLALATNITGTVAPLCPLAACWAPASAIILTSLPATTNQGPPPGTAAAATALASAHTTVVPTQVGTMPLMMPFVDSTPAGFFPVTVTSATTLVVGFDVMGEIHYPANLFNVAGVTYTICGGGVTTPSAATVAGTWTLSLGPRQNSAGTSTAQTASKMQSVASTMWTAAVNTFEFCTDLTTTTTGTSGVVEGHASWFCAGPTGGTAAGVTGCSPWFNAASSAIDLTQEGVIDLTYVQTAASWTLPQLRYFSIRRK